MKKWMLILLAVWLCGVSAVWAQSLECDVVVIGGGGAGLSAAIEAADHGAKVVLVEKMAFLGGETGISGGTIQGAETIVQSKAGVADSRRDLFRYWMEAGHYKNDPELVRAVVDMSAANVEWLMRLGVAYEPRNLGLGGWTPVPRAHRTPGGGGQLIKALEKAARDRGVAILLSTKATELVTENGRVVGVRAEGKASLVKGKAVIIATGGFAANPEMVKQYAPRYVDSLPITTPGITGDGIRMAQALGAKTTGFGGVIGFRKVKDVPYGSTIDGLGRQVIMYVNKEGKRFVDENAYYALVAEAIHNQGGVVYQIFDETKRQALSPAGQKDFDEALASGLIKQGATIEELSTQLGIPPEALASTLSEFNSYAEKGHDPVFWRDATTLVPLTTPPYYGLPVSHANLGTLGGLVINTDAQVIHTSGEAIPGLYAAGSVTGGFFGDVYPAGGSAVAMAVATGRIAGANAALLAK